MTDKTTLQLRRVGAPATYPGVGDIFRLQKQKSILGRNEAAVDIFLDSTMNKRLISRQHAEIILESDENQSFAVSVIDKSLNGTFINDIKIKGRSKLKVGDTVTLGHLQGVQVEPGVFSEQLDSEFRFVLEYADSKHPGSSKLEIKESGEPPDTLKSNRLLRSPNSKLLNGVPPPPPMMHQPIGLVTKLTDRDRVTPVSKATVGEEFRTIEGNDGNLTFIYSVQVDPTKNQTESDRKADKTNTSQGGKLELEAPVGKDPTAGALRNSSRGKGKQVASRGRGRGTGRGAGKHKPNSTGGGRGSSSRGPIKQPTKSAVTSVAVFEFESDSDSDKEAILAIQDQVNAICKSDVDEDFQPDVSKRKTASGSKEAMSKPSQTRSQASSAMTNYKGKASDKRKGKTVSHIHSHKKKRTPPGSSSSKPSAADRGFVAKCSSAECCRPSDLTVSWVQCDDCDSWYHVTCVGCDYNEVKQPGTLFHCGCS